MNSATVFFWKMLENENGAVAVEYALLIGFIAAVVFSAISSLGGTVSGLYNAVKIP